MSPLLSRCSRCFSASIHFDSLRGDSVVLALFRSLLGEIRRNLPHSGVHARCPGRASQKFLYGTMMERSPRMRSDPLGPWSPAIDRGLARQFVPVPRCSAPESDRAIGLLKRDPAGFVQAREAFAQAHAAPFLARAQCEATLVKGDDCSRRRRSMTTGLSGPSLVFYTETKRRLTAERQEAITQAPFGARSTLP